MRKDTDKAGRLGPSARMLLFPAAVLAIYVILLIVMPDKGLLALKSSGSVFRSLVLPLCLVFAIMVLLNAYLRPGQIARYLGRDAGIKGVALSVAAGIISTGHWRGGRE